MIEGSIKLTMTEVLSSLGMVKVGDALDMDATSEECILPDVDYTAATQEVIDKVNTKENHAEPAQGNDIPVAIVGICNRRYTTLGSLNLHVRSIHQGIRHVCQLCDREFRYKANLALHVRATHQGVEHNCQECGKVFTRKPDLIRHKSNVHQDQ